MVVAVLEGLESVTVNCPGSAGSPAAESVAAMLTSPASASDMVVVVLAVPSVATPFGEDGSERVAMMVSSPSISASLVASIVKTNAPLPVPPLKLSSKVSRLTPLKLTPGVNPSAVVRAATKSS